MNATTVLTAINEIKSYSISVQVTEILDRLKAEAEADIRQQTAKASGNANRQKAAEHFLKKTKKTQPERIALHGAWMQGEKQYFSDGYTAFALTQPLPLESISKNVEPLPIIANSIEKASKNDGAKLTLPTVADLKAYIRIKKAEKKPPLWDFGEGLPLVNAEYLLTIFEILPDPVAIAPTKTLAAPIYFASYHGEALLMPCRKD